MSSSNISGHGGLTQSFDDRRVNTTVFDEVDYRGSRVSVYGLMDNDLVNKQEPYKWTFYYLPLFMPVYQPSLDDTNNWVGLTRYNKLTIRLCQGNGELEKMIRESLAKKVSESSAAHASSWTIKPLMIVSFTGKIVRGKDLVPGIESCEVVNPQSIEIELSFGLTSQEDDNAYEVMERIQHGDYQIQLSIEYAGFSRSVPSVLSYSVKSIQDAVSNTLADGPSKPKYIMRSQESSLVKYLSTKIEKTAVMEKKDQPLELEGLGSMLTGFIQSSLNKAEELKVDLGQLANVWAADDLKPELIESEVNKIFKYDESETNSRRDGNKYFKLDVSAGDPNIKAWLKRAIVKIGNLNGQSAGENFVSELHDRVNSTNKVLFSEADVKTILAESCVEVEWKDAKFVPRSIRVVKIADILKDIQTVLESKQTELDKPTRAIIKTVNHETIADSQVGFKLFPRLNTTALHHNVKVGVYKMEGDASSKPVFFFVPLMQSARNDQYSSADSDHNNNPWWIRAVSADQINLDVIQYTQQLKEEIREKVEAGADIQPFIIDSLSARIKDGERGVQGVEMLSLSGPFENIITLRFKVTSNTAQEIVDKILSQEYLVEVSMRLQIPSGPKTNQVSSSPIVRQVNIEETYAIASGTRWPRIAVLKQQGFFAVACSPSIGIKIYDLRSKQLIQTIPTSSTILDLKPFKENRLIGASSNGKIFIWSVETGRLVTTLEGHSGKYIEGISLNKKEMLMLSGGGDKNVILWDMVNFRQIRTFTGHSDCVRSVVFDEPKNRIIGGSGDATIRVWNIQDGSLVRTLMGHSYSVMKVVLDEETGLLYSASLDKTIKQWDLESGRCLKTLTGHSDSVNDLVLSQQGVWLASTAHDKSIIIWDKKTGTNIKRLDYTEKLDKLALNPLNGQLISTSNDSGNIVFWNQNISEF